MKRFSYLIIVLLFSSCSANWHLQRAEIKEPGIFEPITKIEYKDIIIRRDTNIMFDFAEILAIDAKPVIKYDPVIRHDPIEKIESKIRPVKYILPSFDTIIRSDKGLTAKIWMVKGNLKAEFEIDSSLIYELKDSIVVLQEIITHTNTIKIKNKVGFKQYLAGFIIILVLGLLIVIFKRK